MGLRDRKSFSQLCKHWLRLEGLQAWRNNLDQIYLFRMQLLRMEVNPRKIRVLGWESGRACQSASPQAPHYNSAIESGWTHYLDHSFVSGNYFQMSGGVAEDDEEEDLSMVSNASSGPPIYHDDDYECCYGNRYPNHSSSQHTKEKKMTKKVKESDIRQ
ncbi:hypothetical protein QN277_007025 [Acacia crassicarpa]|uniref:Uncharacterized protein n=1 Tax=Acacia crassicarpa TaxID=499986 RepID=A0AAE1ITR6_9FABA|nr:hypothetical protein QN277_007025 [Acacia crassicarpa]